MGQVSVCKAYERIGEMMVDYCKLRVLLNTKQPRRSRVIDVETGKEVPFEDVQINIGRSTKFQLKVQFTMEEPFVEIAAEAPEDPLGISELIK